MISRVTIARSRLRHTELAAQRRARSRRERDDAIGEQQRFIHVVGHHHYGLALVSPERFDLILQARAGEGVERAQRLIEQQDLRLHGQGARHGNSLSHAARELRRPAICRVRKPYELDVFRDLLATLLLRPLRVYGIHGERDVSLHREPGHQRIALEHDAAVMARGGNALPLDPNLTGVRSQQSRDRGNQRGLAAAREPDDRDELTRFDGEVHVMQHVGARAAFAE